MIFRSKRWVYYTGIGLGVLYGLVTRLTFGGDVIGIHLARQYFEVMSLAFIFGVPIALGFITIWFGPAEARKNPVHWVFQPWLAASIFLISTLALYWEGIICIIIWLPLTLFLSSIGGVLAGFLNKNISGSNDRNLCVAIVAFAPFLAAPLEQLHQANLEIRTVNTQIVIHGTREQVWSQIKTVPLIRENEQSFSFSHLLGFPRPLEAHLEGQGVGAVRYATFEHGVLFVETISEWDEPRRLSFSIRADTAHIPPTTFDEHITIGGKYFDVLNGTYWIEPIGPRDVLLHLSSEQRLSTRFNFYTHFWTGYLMGDLQDYILHIIKRRCETTSSNP